MRETLVVKGLSNKGKVNRLDSTILIWKYDLLSVNMEHLFS